MASVFPATVAVPDSLALRLGYAGLIPFVGCALLVWLLPQRPQEHAFVIDAMAKYAALIVSFLGGIHWGLAFRGAAAPRARFAWGVLPSVLAWGALLMPAHAALVVLGSLLIVCYLVDRRVYPANGLAAWLTLRFRLSVVASLSCFIAAVGS